MAPPPVPMRWLVEGEKYLKVKVPDFWGMNNYPSILENYYYSLTIYIYIYTHIHTYTHTHIYIAKT